MKKIAVSAPGKLMLLGEHSVVYGHPCIVTAVDQRMFCKAEFIERKDLLQINAPEVDVYNYAKSMNELGKGLVPKGAKFVEIAIKNFRDAHLFEDSIRITTSSDFSANFGFGSSSAATVCVIKALSELFELHLSNKQLFDLSFKTVLDIQGTGSGFDVAAAIYGGTIYFKNKGEVIENVKIDHLPLVVGYSGIKADTVTLIKQVAKLGIQKPELVEKIFFEIDGLVEKGKVALEKKDFDSFGKFMNQNQHLLSQLGVCIEKLDAMIDAAIRAGAYGAKLSGAGGGDCIIALCAKNNEQKVKKEIEKVGGEILDVTIHAEGVRIENS